MSNPKHLDDYIPVLKDQGIKNLVGSPVGGVSAFVVESTAVAGVITLPHTMEDALYTVFAQNDTDQTRTATISAKTVSSFTTTLPQAADVQSYLVIGRIKDQQPDAG